MGSNNYQEELKGLLEDQRQIFAKYINVIESFAKEDFALQNQLLRMGMILGLVFLGGGVTLLYITIFVSYFMWGCNLWGVIRPN